MTLHECEGMWPALFTEWAAETGTRIPLEKPFDGLSFYLWMDRLHREALAFPFGLSDKWQPVQAWLNRQGLVSRKVSQ